MKRITRMIIFSAVALYLTSFWNAGFKVNFTPDIYFRTILLIALFYYLVVPISKIILLPINLLTLGLLSSILYFILFYIFITRFSFVQIKAWNFPGIEFYGLSLKSFPISYFLNLLLSSVSLSFIINLLEAIL